MKKKMMAAVVLSVLILGLLSTSTVHAAYSFFVCTVVATGQGSGVIYVALTDTAATPAFTAKWFSVNAADVTSANRFLATALTAISSGNKVYVYTDPSLAGEPPLSRLYLLNY